MCGPTAPASGRSSKTRWRLDSVSDERQASGLSSSTNRRTSSGRPDSRPRGSRRWLGSRPHEPTETARQRAPPYRRSSHCPPAPLRRAPVSVRLERAETGSDAVSRIPGRDDDRHDRPVDIAARRRADHAAHDVRARCAGWTRRAETTSEADRVANSSGLTTATEPDAAHCRTYGRSVITRSAFRTASWTRLRSS